LKGLEHIEEISGVEDGIRKWVVVTCDGVPYHRALRMKKAFPWLILVPGALQYVKSIYQTELGH